MTFAGTTFGVVVNATGNNLLFNGSVFGNSLTAVKKGSSNDNSIGNNFFNGAVTLIDSGSGSLVLANTTTAPDTFNSTLTVSARSTGAVYLAHQGTGNVFNGDVTFSTGNIFSNTYGTAAYNGNIALNSASANISFGNSTGSWTLASGKNISIGTFSAGTLTIRNLTQSDNLINMRLALTGTGKLVLGNNSISAKLYASSNQLTFAATRFLSADTLIYTGGNNATSAGGNYFGSTVYIANTYTGTNYHFTIGSTSVDTFTTTTTIATTGNTSLDVANGLFLGAVTFKNSITGTLSDRFYVWDCTFKGTLTLDGIHSAIKFKNGTGNSLIDSTATLSLVSGYAGQLTLSYIEQRGSNAINLNMSTNTSTGNNTILTIGPNAIFNSDFYYLGQRLELNGGTFNSNASFTRFSQQPDICTGSNVFNGNTLICDSVAATTANRVFKLANTNPDDFNGNVTFKQYGTGSSASTMKMYPAYTANSTFAGNVIVESNNVPIEFGANGGKVILDGTGSQSISKVGSYNPAIKKLEVNKSLSTCTLNLPLTVSDSLIFKKGFIASDTTNLLLIPDNCIVTGTSDTSFATGYVKKTGNDAFTFPLGIFYGEANHTPSEYHPLSISAPANATDAFTAKYFWANHNKGTNADSTIENESICEYWKLERNAGTSNVTVKLGWNTLSCNVYGLDSMHIAVWDTATSKWKDKGNGGTTGNLTSGTVVSSSAISTFGIMTLADKFCTSLQRSLIQNNIRCSYGFDGSAIVIPTGATPPYSYVWSNNKGSDSLINDLDTGNYVCTITDSRGCIVRDTIQITKPEPITIILSSTPSDCSDSTGTAIAAASGGTGTLRYRWVPENLLNDTVNNLSSGIHTLIVNDEKGCVEDTTIYLSDSNGPSASINVLSNPTCFSYSDGSAEVEVSSGASPFKYSWIAYPDSDSTAFNLRAGIIFATVTDNEGCITFVSDTIDQPEEIIISLEITNSDCKDSSGSVEATVTGGTGGLEYSWSSGGKEYLESNLGSGYDTLVVMDENGCIATDIAKIVDNDGPTLSTNVIQNVTCFGGADGSAFVSVSGGTSPYTYIWYPYQHEAILTDTSDTVITTVIINDTLFNSKAGHFKVMVTDSNGCRQSAAVTIEQPPRLFVSAYPVLPSTDSTSDGSIRLAAEGGILPYSYLWLPDSSNSYLKSAQGIGVDTFVVTDANGCTFSDIITLRSISSINSTLCPGNTPYDITPDPVTCIEDPCGSPWGCPSLSMRQFGAIPDDGLSDECAFEAANQYMMTYVCGGSPTVTTFTLFIPGGVYIVGRQNQLGNYYLQGHHVICLDDCHVPITIEGELGPGNIPLVLIEFEDCMKYGAFDPATGDRYVRCSDNVCFGCPLSATGTLHSDIQYGAYPGNFLVMSNSSNVTVKNLAINGNLDNMSIGGYFATDLAGINLPHSGISVVTCSEISIDNVICSVFGQDGINISYYEPNAAVTNMNISLNRVICSLNGRSGISWTGGGGVNLTYCDFFHNAKGRISTKTASGIDIEWEAGNSRITDGYFNKCRFMFNDFCGVLCDNDKSHSYANFTNFFNFSKCLFVGSEDGFAAWPNGQSFNFTQCFFYGRTIHAYDANGNNSPVETVFNKCIFNEEYTNGFSLNHDNCDECGTANVCASHPWLIEFFIAGKVTFNACDINTNKQARLIFLQGAFGYEAQMVGTHLRNYGLLDFPDLGTMYYVNHPNSWLHRSQWWDTHAWWNYGITGDSPQIDPVILQYKNCQPKYYDISYPDRVSLFSGLACNSPWYETFSPYCPPSSPRIGLLEKQEIKQTNNLYPNPAIDYTIIKNVNPGDEIVIRDIIGRDIAILAVKQQPCQVDISMLPPGFYSVVINGRVSNKLIKE